MARLEAELAATKRREGDLRVENGNLKDEVGRRTGKHQACFAATYGKTWPIPL